MEEAACFVTFEEPLLDVEITNEQVSSVVSRRQARAKLYLQDSHELKDFWDIMTSFVCAACHGSISVGGGLRLVHDAVTIECSPLLIRFAAALFPEELLEQEECSGRVPLHTAATQRSQGILQTLLELEPKAISVKDSSGRLPLHLALQAQLPWKGALELLVAAWPHSLTIVDPSTGLLPALSAIKCSTDAIFNLVCANPTDVCHFALELTKA